MAWQQSDRGLMPVGFRLPRRPCSAKYVQTEPAISPRALITSTNHHQVVFPSLRKLTAKPALIEEAAHTAAGTHSGAMALLTLPYLDSRSRRSFDAASSVSQPYPACTRRNGFWPACLPTLQSPCLKIEAEMFLGQIEISMAGCQSGRPRLAYGSGVS